MFNAASRLACKDRLDKDMPDLVCVFDLLYHQSNVIWYQQPDGTWDKFLQDEGKRLALMSELGNRLALHWEQRIGGRPI